MTNDNQEKYILPDDKNSDNQSQTVPSESAEGELPLKRGFTESFSFLIGEYVRIARIPNVWVISLSLSALLTFMSMWLFVLPLYLKRLGASENEIGVGYLWFFVAFSISQILGGYLADKIGRKKLLIYPSFLLPIVYIAAACSRDWMFVMVFLTLGNLIQGLQTPALYSLMAESVEEKDRGMSFSILEISISMGYTIGPFIGAFLFQGKWIKSFLVNGIIKNSDPVQLMILLTGIILIPACFIRFLIRDVVKHEDFQVTFSDIKNAFNRNLIILLLAFIFFGLMIDTTFYGPFIPLYAKEKLGMDEKTILTMFMLGGLFAMFFNLVNGKITAHLGSKKAMIVGTLGHAFLFIPWLLSGNINTAVMIYIPSYLFLQLSYIAHDTIMSEVTDIRTRSTVVGVFFTIPGLFGALAPLIGSRLITPFGSASPFILGMFFAVITVILLALVKSERN